MYSCQTRRICISEKISSSFNLRFKHASSENPTASEQRVDFDISYKKSVVRRAICCNP